MQAYDRLLWEAMRPEHLQDRVVDPQKFVEGIEETVVIHDFGSVLDADEGRG